MLPKQIESANGQRSDAMLVDSGNILHACTYQHYILYNPKCMPRNFYHAFDVASKGIHYTTSIFNFSHHFKVATLTVFRRFD